MSRSQNRPLFNEKELSNLTSGYEAEIRNEVEGWERNKVLAASEPDLIAYLVEKYTLDPPRLLPDEIHIESEGETRVDISLRPEFSMWNRNGPNYVPGSYVTVAIPFEGEGKFFGFQASTFTYNPPRGRVVGETVLIDFQDVKLNHQKIQQEIKSTVDSIKEYLSWIKNDCDKWNARVQAIAEQCVRDRKNRLLEQASMVSALGLPIKRRPDSTSSFSIPVVRKKRPVSLPSTPREVFKPEPELSNSEYDYILTIIDRLSQNIERSPSTFVSMGEEQIRDLILVSLNGHYKGDATGETFNGHGKTDILIRADERNVFIAECKFWKGQKSLYASIEQILRYLTWRDTKAALLLFSKNLEFTNVLSSIADAVPLHPNFKRELQQVSETHIRYLFRQKKDPARDIYLAVQVFNIPRKEVRPLIK